MCISGTSRSSVQDEKTCRTILLLIMMLNYCYASQLIKIMTAMFSIQTIRGYIIYFRTTFACHYDVN